ncbi:hypothetical protein R5R35_005258 [Gryllus longicercus]|uniref:Metalloendopeptidase n=1 Tax=Gryllus longicercus TaxID=2509291 RepID=A0AAN9VKX6_9ORTH
MKTLLVALACIAGALAVPVNPTGEAPLWTRSGQWQGDIVLSPEQKVAIRSGRTGLINTYYRWGDRTIPYKLRDGDFNEAQAAIIRNSLEEYNTRTCVRVREATAADRDWVLVTREDSGCWSYVGRQGGQQQLNLQDNQWGTCLISGTVVHEFLHAFGFYHQQSATERDDYVQILWDNIQDGTAYNFDKYGADLISEFGVEYDTESVMHYDKYAFSKNGQPTIISIRDPNQSLGNNRGLTDRDILKLNRMYGC